MTSDTTKSPKVPTLEDMDELGNRILIRTYENIETMKEGIVFTDSQLERIQGMISKCKCTRDLKELNIAHKTLLETKYFNRKNRN
jgi:hypothetical protein